MTVPAQFDELVHAPLRLQICTMLAAASSMEFAAVRDVLEVADSVLSKHVRALSEAGYVAVHKAALRSRVRTSLSLTPRGRVAYQGHLAALRAIVEAGSAQSPSTHEAGARSGRQPISKRAAAARI